VSKAKSRKRPERLAPADPSSARARIIYAAFGAFLEHGFSKVTMLEIATRAKVSKRDLYAEFESKSALLVYCITHRAQRIKLPEQLPEDMDRTVLAETLTTFGAAVLRELTIPEVLAAYRLAIAESWTAPEIAQTINKLGREVAFAALTGLIKQAQAKELLDNTDPRELADQFFALVCRDLHLQLLLGVAKPPSHSALQRRAEIATEAFLALHRPISA
jgi:AcrR family transcriptional regulator